MRTKEFKNLANDDRLNKDYRIASNRMLWVMGLVKSYCKSKNLSDECISLCVNEAKKKLRSGASAGYSIFVGQNLAKKLITASATAEK